jgi:hypothetical protein
MTDVAASIAARSGARSTGKQKPESKSNPVKKATRASSDDALPLAGKGTGAELDQEQLKRVAGGFPPNPCGRSR